MPRKLPFGITDKILDEALDAMVGAIGKRWVLRDAKSVAGYRDSYSILEPDHFVASAAVAPANVEEIQKLLQIANQYRIPMSPISGGRNQGYGGPAPRLPGSVMLDLKRMNRILEVNEEFGYALVEPGVSYMDLYEYLQENDIKLWLDVPAAGWGSVLGNTVDRGVGYTPYGDHFSMQCGMEVVLANGDVVRTGMGALPGNNTWQLFKYGFGPYLDGIFTQSNFGVVTKLGIWLMPEPPGYRPIMITVPREEDLEALVDIMLPLKVSMVIPNAAVMASLLFEGAIKSTKKQYYAGEGPLPDSAAKKMMADHKIGMWNFYAALYGPDKIMDASWEVIRDAFSKIPGAKFYLREDREGDIAMEYRTKLMSGVPNLTEFTNMNWVDGGGHVDFTPVSPTNGAEALKQYAMIRDRVREFGFDYFGLFIVGWRELHHILVLIFRYLDPQEREKARELFGILIEEAAREGYGEYRTHLAYMDQIAATYNWNDNSLMRLNETIKDAVDPNGILAPGKSGIWPKHLRGKGL